MEKRIISTQITEEDYGIENSLRPSDVYKRQRLHPVLQSRSREIWQLYLTT